MDVDYKPLQLYEQLVRNKHHAFQNVKRRPVRSLVFIHFYNMVNV